MDLAEAERRVGTTLCNKWTLERVLGVGGMAAVYAAAHKIGRRDAIKILHVAASKNQDLRSRFELEAHVGNRFRHPGAVEIRDVDTTEDGCPFLVMELLEGESLSERASKGPVAVDDALRWIDELLDVLIAAHAQGIIHRDVKPDNLFVTRAGPLKVFDFGIARVRDSGRAGFARTAMGAMLGTATYMPPEQVQGREIDPRADLFAVGATMFRVLARRRIHEAPSETEMLVKMGSLPAPPIGSVAPEVPGDVQLIVDRALRFDREERYPDAATMQADVRAVRAGKPPPFASTRKDASAAGFATIAQPASTRNAAGPRDAPAFGATVASAMIDGPTRVETDKPSIAVVAASAPFSERGAGPSSDLPSIVASPLGATAVSSSGMSPLAMSHPTAAPSIVQYTAPPVSSAQMPLVGTLKSAGIVALPDAAPPSHPLVDVMSAPALKLEPERSNVALWLVGAGFLVLGVVLAVVLTWPSREPPRPQPPTPPAAPDEEPENAKHPHEHHKRHH